MPKPIVLLVHGMGTHDPKGITEEFTKGLKNGADFLGYKNLNIEDMEIVEFNYSKELDDLRKQIADHASKTQKQLSILTGAGGIAGFAAKVSGIQAKFSGDEFLYTHLLDVLIYGTTMYRAKVYELCAQSIKTHMYDAYNKHTAFHIVAHSLGTAVVTDAMAHLFSYDATIDNPDQINTGANRPDSVWMISNVSRLIGMLNDSPDPYDTIVNDRRDLAARQFGACGAMYNIRNTYDPFTWIKTYADEPEMGVNVEFKEVRKIKSESTFINPHDLTEYFSNPEITYHFLARVFSYSVAPADFVKGYKEYRESALKGQVKQILAKIKKPVKDDLPDDASLLDKIKYIQKIYTALKKTIDESKEYFSTNGEQ
jgi:hypothetical protein